MTNYQPQQLFIDSSQDLVSLNLSPLYALQEERSTNGKREGSPSKRLEYCVISEDRK